MGKKEQLNKIASKLLDRDEIHLAAKVLKLADNADQIEELLELIDEARGNRDLARIEERHDAENFWIGKVKEYTKQLKNLKSQQGYEPYEGPAGPTFQQVQQNDKTLLRILKEKGVDAKYVPIPDYFGDFEPENRMVQVGDRWAYYDRHGFAVGDLEGAQRGVVSTRQLSLEDAVEYLSR